MYFTVFPNTLKWFFKHICQFFYYKMLIVFWSIMKNYRDFIWQLKFQITNDVCWNSIFTCIMAMISNFLIVYIIKEFFYDLIPANIRYSSFFVKCFFVNGNFFFSNPIILVACYFKDSQNFFIQDFLRYKVCLFLFGDCWYWISARSCGLFAHPSFN